MTDSLLTEAAAARSAPFNISKLQSALNGNAADLGILPQFRQVRSKFSIHAFETLPSTNAKVWDMLAAGAPAGTVAIAREQTAGRGQRGRTWQSAPGGLYLSLALEPDWPAECIAQLTCISAWGIAAAFNNLGVPIKIKWPNDLFFEGKKLGGILTETKLSQTAAHSSRDRYSAQPSSFVRQAVIGVGINWHNSAPATAVTLSKILGSLPNSAAKNKINCLEMLSALVLKGILQGYLFQQQIGSQDFMKVYSTLLTQVGEVVSLDSDLLDLAIANKDQLDKLRRFKNCSGEVVGISERVT